MKKSQSTEATVTVVGQKGNRKGEVSTTITAHTKKVSQGDNGGGVESITARGQLKKRKLVMVGTSPRPQGKWGKKKGFEINEIFIEPIKTKGRKNCFYRGGTEKN